MISMKAKVYQVRGVKRLNDVSTAVSKWEEERDFLAESCKHVMSLEDQHHGLLTICPPDIRRAIF